ASLNRRFSKGLTVQLGYTWSRLLTTSPEDRSLATYNTYNLGQSYGPSILNTPQMFIASYVYDLPFYRNQNGFAGSLLGGWLHNLGQRYFLSALSRRSGYVPLRQHSAGPRG